MERTVIIPALNPDEGLREIVERNWELENQIILVDDGSDKKYERLFWELGEKCIVLHHEENRGKGEAIKTALKYIKEELWECRVVGIMDADGQHLPDDMEKLLMKAAAEPMALIVGSRTIDRNVPWKSRMGNLITRRIFRMKTGVEVSDTQTGLRAFSTRLLDFMLDIEGERYEYEMNVLVTCAKANIPIIEVPIETIYHDKGNSCSHFRKVRDSVRIYRQLLKFSFVSFSGFLLGGIYGVNYLIPQKGISARPMEVRAADGQKESRRDSQRESQLASQKKLNGLPTTKVSLDTQDWHEKFADKFTDRIVSTDTSYTSPNVSVKLTYYSCDTNRLDKTQDGNHEKYGTNISYVLADIYVGADEICSCGKRGFLQQQQTPG